MCSFWSGRRRGFPTMCLLVVTGLLFSLFPDPSRLRRRSRHQRRAGRNAPRCSQSGRRWRPGVSSRGWPRLPRVTPGRWAAIRPGSRTEPLIEHWNGRLWRQVPSPQPGTPGTGRSAGGRLAAVAALSFEDAWTVGWSGTTALAEHWDGSSWQLSPVAGAGRYQGSRLLAVAASPVRGAWAVGAYRAGRAGPGGQSRGLIGRWNGTGWALAAAPLPSGAIGAVLNGVTVSSSGV